MKIWFEKLTLLGNRFLERSDWRDLALVKLCLCSIGVLIGLAVRPEKRRLPRLLAAAVFVGTYVPLMRKFFRIAAGSPSLPDGE